MNTEAYEVVYYSSDFDKNADRLVVFKIRLPNNDTNVGKSNGYRIIYLARHDNRTVAFLFIYYKKEQESIADTYVSALVEGYFLHSLPEEE